MEYQIESKLADGQWVADGIGVENYPRSYGECEADIALLREIGGGVRWDRVSDRGGAMTSAPGRETPGLEPLLLSGARLEG